MSTLKHIAKKYKLNFPARSPIELPKVSRIDLAKLFTELGFTKGAEVGTWAAAYSNQLCQNNDKLNLIGVDLDSKTPRRDVPNNCKILKMSSLNAAKKVVDGSLDFVYLDTNEDLTSTINSIHEWSKKVRSGGIIAGHDYFRYRQQAQIHTYEALHAYLGAYRVTPWFIVGRDVEPVRSWFWVKA